MAVNNDHDLFHIIWGILPNPIPVVFPRHQNATRSKVRHRHILQRKIINSFAVTNIAKGTWPELLASFLVHIRRRQHNVEKERLTPNLEKTALSIEIGEKKTVPLQL